MSCIRRVGLRVLVATMILQLVVAGAAAQSRLTEDTAAQALSSPIGADAPPTAGGPTMPNNSSAANSSVPDQVNDSLLSTSSFPTPTQVPANKSIQVRLTVRNTSAINRTRLHTLGVELGSQYQRQLEATVPAAALPTLRELPWVEHVQRVTRPVPTTISEGVTAMHAIGVRPDSSEYKTQVAATKAFHPSGITGADPTHGTAVTELVADTAPNASLYLTSISTAVELAKAVAWLRDQNVDVIVMSLIWTAAPDTGAGYVSSIVANATTAGIFWANAAGNAAQKHWQGHFQNSDEDSLLNFTASDETIALRNGQTMPAGTPISLTLKWQDFPETTTDYTLYLVGVDQGIVAQSYRLSADAPVEVLQTTLPADDEYFFIITGNASAHLIEVFGSDYTIPFEHFVREGSILAPSMAPGVTGVGAYHVDTNRLAAYSSAGPTNDGARGIDLLAPAKVST